MQQLLINLTLLIYFVTSLEMNSESKNTKAARLKSDWVEDAVNLQSSTSQKKRYAVAVTIFSCVVYAVLYYLVAEYRLEMADHIRELPIFTRVVLNIFQPFLIVFIIISLSLLVLFYLRIKKPWLSLKLLMIIMVFNSLFAMTLLAVSVLKVI